MIDVWDRLQTLHDQIKADLIADGTPSPTDAAIQTAMLAVLKSCREATTRFTNLRA
jgi:hypothetical protein